MRERLGTFLIIVSAASFGAMPILARFAYESGMDPVSVLALRFPIAGAALWSILAVRRRPAPKGRTLLGLVLMGAVLYVGQSLSYFTALQFASAGLVALLLYLYPTIVAVASIAFFGDRLTSSKLVALALAVTGSVLTIGPLEGGRAFGILLGIAAAVIYSIYILVGSRVTSETGALQASAVIMTSAAVVYALISAWRGLLLPNSAIGWLAVLSLALVCTVVASVTFFAGLRYVGPTTAATLSTVEPAVTVALEAILFDVPVRWYLIAGGGLILVAVIILARSGAVDRELEVSTRPEV